MRVWSQALHLCSPPFLGLLQEKPAPFLGGRGVQPTFMRGLSETITFTPAGRGERAEIEEPGLSLLQSWKASASAGRAVDRASAPRTRRQTSFKQPFLPCPLAEGWEDAGGWGAPCCCQSESQDRGAPRIASLLGDYHVSGTSLSPVRVSCFLLQSHARVCAYVWCV